MSLNSNKEMIVSFRWKIELSDIGHDDDVILEPCSEREIANMIVLYGLPTPYFYLNLPFIPDIGILIPFKLLKSSF